MANFLPHNVQVEILQVSQASKNQAHQTVECMQCNLLLKLRETLSLGYCNSQPDPAEFYLRLDIL